MRSILTSETALLCWLGNAKNHQITFSHRKKESQSDVFKVKSDMKDCLIPFVLPRASAQGGACFSTPEIIIKADTKSLLQSCCCEVSSWSQLFLTFGIASWKTRCRGSRILDNLGHLLGQGVWSGTRSASHLSEGTTFYPVVWSGSVSHLAITSKLHYWPPFGVQ